MDDHAPLGSLADINPRSPSARIGEPISFVSMADVSERGYLENVLVRPASPGYTAFVEGDVLLAKITPCMENGKGAHIRGLPIFQGQGSTEFHVLRARPGTSDRFLYHLTRTESFRLRAEALMTGSAGQRRVPTEFFSKYVVRVPPLDEQQRIAEILDTIDETIQATERVIAKLSVTASGLASAAVAAAIAGPGIRSIGQIAEGAPGSLVQTGPFGSQLHASDYVREGVPTIMPTDIANGRLDIAGAAKITESKANELGRHRLRSGDVLFGRRGDLSRCAVVPDGAAGGLCGTGCLLVRIPNDVVTADWLALVYRHDYVQRQVLGRAVGSTMLNLSGGLIRSLLVPLPTEESEHLMAAFRSNEQRLEAESNQLSKLRELRMGLASDLLSGRVRTVAA